MADRLLRAVVFAGVLLTSPRVARAEEGGSPVDIELGVGPTGFVGGVARGLLEDAAGVELRIAIATRFGIGFELAYADSLHGVTEPSMPEASLRAVSSELGLRWSPLSTIVEPYLVLGLRETYYRVVDWGASRRISIVDYVTQVPLGIGITRRFGRGFADVRGTYRFAFEEDLLDAGEASLDTWSAMFGVGFRL